MSIIYLNLTKVKYLRPLYTFIQNPKIEPNKTTIDILNIRAQVNARQKKWGKDIDLQSNKTTTEDINEFMKFKILEYKAYDFKDNKL